MLVVLAGEGIEKESLELVLSMADFKPEDISLSLPESCSVPEDCCPLIENCPLPEYVSLPEHISLSEHVSLLLDSPSPNVTQSKDSSRMLVNIFNDFSDAH